MRLRHLLPVKRRDGNSRGVGLLRAQLVHLFSQQISIVGNQLPSGQKAQRELCAQVNKGRGEWNTFFETYSQLGFQQRQIAHLQVVVFRGAG